MCFCTKKLNKKKKKIECFKIYICNTIFRHFSYGFSFVKQKFNSEFFFDIKIDIDPIY